MDNFRPEKTIRIAILSFAHTAHAVSYSSAISQMQGVSLAGIYAEDPQAGRKYAAQFQAPFFDDLDDLLGIEEIDAVIVTSPTSRHRELVTAAARAGKHVLCEKPVATTLPDARAMITACREAGVLLQIPFVCRFYPMVLKAKQLVQEGEIGRVIGAVGGNRGVPPLPPTYPDWILDPLQAGGGALLDHSVHVTDTLRFILEEEACSVFAQKGDFRSLGLQVEDCGLLSLEFGSGIIATVDPSWSIPLNNPYHYDFYLRILGEKGTLQLDDTRQALTVVSDRTAEPGVTAVPFGVDVDAEMVRHFVRCVRAGENLPPAASGEDGLRALEIALAAYESIRLGQPVQLPGQRN